MKRLMASKEESSNSLGLAADVRHTAHTHQSDDNRPLFLARSSARQTSCRRLKQSQGSSGPIRLAAERTLVRSWCQSSAERPTRADFNNLVSSYAPHPFIKLGLRSAKNIISRFVLTIGDHGAIHYCQLKLVRKRGGIRVINEVSRNTIIVAEHGVACYRKWTYANRLCWVNRHFQRPGLSQAQSAKLIGIAPIVIFCVVHENLRLKPGESHGIIGGYRLSATLRPRKSNSSAAACSGNREIVCINYRLHINGDAGSQSRWQGATGEWRYREIGRASCRERV